MKNPKDNFIIERIKSIKFSFRGIWFLITTESSIKAQLFIAILVSIAGIYFQINSTEWILQTLAIGLVLVAESLNTYIFKWLERQKMLQVKIIQGLTLLWLFLKIDNFKQ